MLKFNSGKGENTYSARVRILKTGSLEETECILEDVPLSPIWANSQGAGVYAPLPEGTLVIVAYVEHNPSYPYIQALWGEFYNAADFKPDELLITNGTISITVKSGELHLNGSDFGGLIKIGELAANLNKNVEVLSSLIDALRKGPITESGNGAPSALQGALAAALTGKNVGDFSQLENTAVKHG
ncbi:hypothetical protein S1OALGB6SA_440 [Olavius algarvensis spirochete endosymbiont]|uniref:hypothetical protein n=1 Tax=Olavius algarvensis spirochete endosymbiont TaxID=260710 RepID=UPI000F16BC09|nr:hypothetical protein [Olavius algarvensis spirochete endosymbiont]VDA99372.1 hypothetical protein S1OALGB6SA_440 [Olavius algarvensis spirochete endosymbiont]